MSGFRAVFHKKLLLIKELDQQHAKKYGLRACFSRFIGAFGLVKTAKHKFGEGYNSTMVVFWGEKKPLPASSIYSKNGLRILYLIFFGLIQCDCLVQMATASCQAIFVHVFRDIDISIFLYPSCACMCHRNNDDKTACMCHRNNDKKTAYMCHGNNGEKTETD